LIATVLVAIFAEPITIWLLIPRADPAQQALTVQLLRVMLATVVIFAISGLSMAILNAHQKFLAASLAPGMYNIGLIAGAVLLVPTFGVFGLAYGAVIGAALHLIVQLPAQYALRGRFRPTLAIHTPGVSEVIRLMGPRVLGLGVVQINYWVNAALTSGMVAGSLTALTFAFALLFTVLGVLGQSVGTAVFPTLSALNARDDMDGFRRVLAGAVRGVLFMALPATVGLIVLAKPLVDVIYHHGQWSAQDTDATAWALQFYAVGLSAFALQEVLARAFYALRDTFTPVLIGVAGVIFNVILSLILMHVVGTHQTPFGQLMPFMQQLSGRTLWLSPVGEGPFGGLALANALATVLESIALWALISRRLNGITDRVVLSTAGRELIAALLMGVIVLLTRMVLMRMLSTPSPLLILAIGAAVGMIAYEGLTLAFGLAEARSVPRALLRRFRR